MTKAIEAEHAYYGVLRTTLLAFIKGTPAIMAVEMGRRAIPQHVRPGFGELEKACRDKGGQEAEAG